ncbi:MAG: hypothetical protein LVQ97_05020 [Candidatus Micrarchaeales archaeon]|jgi:hypothetical protein|uniref:Uncharacterized protein n=1 Tax=Candidatus Micrarchaeum acidiphilum ARMAN-2 TaxID=425595 RepID=C7DGT0_MICA2|nr:MAG: hypothetical protein UNLARM2_0280 [Candidatus Micrarchaeum acidiphilum ARMAN-2]MCW6161521.1 hypothetical protein [Candidatus Micrarchaeales archaeon]
MVQKKKALVMNLLRTGIETFNGLVGNVQEGAKPKAESTDIGEELSALLEKYAELNSSRGQIEGRKNAIGKKIKGMLTDREKLEAIKKLEGVQVKEYENGDLFIVYKGDATYRVGLYKYYGIASNVDLQSIEDELKRRGLYTSDMVTLDVAALRKKMKYSADSRYAELRKSMFEGMLREDKFLKVERE